MTLSSNLTYGYGKGTFNPENKAPSRPFWCRYESATREPKPFREECVEVAKLIHRNTLRPIAVLLSGGMDSEVVLRSFLEAGIKVEPWIICIGEYSTHEVAQAERVCEEQGVKLNYVYTSTDWLKSDRALELYNKSHCHSIEMLPHMQLMMRLYDFGYHCVLGNGEVMLERRGRDKWDYVEYEYDLAWYRFTRAFEIEATCGFFQQTPEIQLAALQHKRHVDVAGTHSNRLANTILKNSRPIKYRMYKDEWPDIREREKFDGFEKLRSFGMKLQLDYERQQYRDTYNDKFSIPYDAMVKDLRVHLDRPSTD